MEGFVTGTADPTELQGIRDSPRRAGKRKRKEEKALRRELKRQKRALASKTLTENEEEEEERVEEWSPQRAKVAAKLTGAVPGMLTPESTGEVIPPSPVVEPIPLEQVHTPPEPAVNASVPSTSSTPSNPASQPAGPSKPRRTLNRPKTPSSSYTRQPPRDSSEKPTDEELRARFSTPGAMELYIASKWLNLTELKRLADEGIITYKKGKFGESETKALRQHLELFSHMNRLNRDELVRIMMAKGRHSERKEFSHFWLDCAAVVPGRPVKYVKDHVKRLYDPRGNKGPWSTDEDAALLRAYEVHPDEWSKIADIVDRTEQDVRDRYKNELAHQSTKRMGHWTKDEEELLIEYVTQANRALGKDQGDAEAPWDLIAEKMGGTRTRLQCRKKWKEDLMISSKNNGEKENFHSHDRPLLVQAIQRLGVETEGEVTWDGLSNGRWERLSGKSLRHVWGRMKHGVTDHESIPFPDLVNELKKRYPVLIEKPKRRKSSEERRIISRDVIESGDEDGADEAMGEVESEEGD